MSLIHNRTGALALVAALAVVFLGAGCQKQGDQSNSGKLDQGTSPSSDATSALPTKWAEYRSDKLGITIPYPEGWYVEESTEQETGNRSVDFYESQPSSASDAPSLLWLDRRASPNIESVIQEEFPAVRSRAQVTRSGLEMTRITFPYDERLASDVGMSAYIWQDRNGTAMIGGQEGSAILEYVLDRLEVLQ